MMPGCCLLLLLAASGLPAHHVYHGVAVAPDGHSAWVACSDSVVVYHTSDLGASWESEFVATVRRFSDICFIDSLCGWTCGSIGDIFHTTDGGRTWSRQNLGGPRLATRIRFLNDSVGWCTGDDRALLATTDGGHTWQVYYLPFTTMDSVDGQGAHVVSPDTIWLAAGKAPSSSDTGHTKGDGRIVKSTDGGETWTLALRDTVLDFYDVHFIDERNGVVVGGNDQTGEGAVLRTSDGGAAWQPASILPRAWYLRTVAFSGSDYGWACGDSGTIIKTANCGLSWEAQQTPTRATLYDIEFADRWRGMAAGDGVVLRTTDGGTTWTPVTPVAITEPAAPSAQTALSLSVIQNPARGHAEFTATGVASARELAILDALGRQVAFTHGRSWDGRGESGRLLPSGIYFARLTSRGTTLATPFTYLSR